VLHHLARGAGDDDLAAGVAAFGAEVDDPVGGADDVEVVLDHHQRMAGSEQLAQRAHQLGHIIEMQAGGGLVEQQQRTALAGVPRELAGDCVGDAALGRLRQEPGNLQALSFTAGQRRHRLAELHVFETDVRQRLQRTHHLARVGEEDERLAHGEVEHLGHAQAHHRAAPGAGGGARSQRRRQIHRGSHAPLDRHFQHLGPEALAVAIGAAQVDVGEELHLDVLEAVAAAGRAAAVAGVEAEHAGGVAALDREPRLGEQRTDAVPRADVARRVAARGLADRALVDHRYVGQPVVAEQAIECARRLGGLALGLAQCREQDVLHQRALARAGHARDHHQVVERELHRHVLQVVLARAFEQQARRVGPHVARRVALARERLHLDLLAARQVVAGQRMSAADRLGRAVGDDLAAALAGAGAHVEQAVGGQHHLRVVLDHHQAVAGAAQPVHHLDHAMHVARVQADAWLVQHEQRVDERGAERGGEVDPLHLAAGQRAALAVERQITETDIAQELQARAHLVEQQFGRVVHHAAEADAVEEAAHAVQRQQHQIVHRQSRHGIELRRRPVRVRRLVAVVAAGGQAVVAEGGVGIGGIAHPPQQRIELQPRAVARGAGGIRAIARQQHADVHLVRLALQPAEVALDAVPLLLPLAGPLRLALDHPVAVLGLHQLPRRIERDAELRRELLQVALALGKALGLPRLDRAAAQRLALVGNHEPQVETDHPPEATTRLARAQRRIERERARVRLRVMDVAVGAVQVVAEPQQFRQIGVRFSFRFGN
jgi:hypothetical protein